MTRRRTRHPATVQSVGSFRRSIVQIQIGAQTYDAVFAPSCKTCQHPARMLIEEKIIQNHSFRAIAEQFSEATIDGEDGHPMTLPRITHQSIYTHFHNGHMPLQAATLRRLAERRAKQIGRQYEEAGEQFVDHIVLAEATIARTYERLVTGQIQPDVKDGLAAAKMIADVEADTQAGLDQEAWSEAMMIYFETARQHMEPVAWERFTRSLSANPILRALERRLSPDPNVIDAEPVAIEGAAS